jgi:hypothetical protein
VSFAWHETISEEVARFWASPDAPARPAQPETIVDLSAVLWHVVERGLRGKATKLFDAPAGMSVYELRPELYLAWLVAARTRSYE